MEKLKGEEGRQYIYLFNPVFTGLYPKVARVARDVMCTLVVKEKIRV